MELNPNYEVMDNIYNKFKDMNTYYQSKHSKVLALRFDFRYNSEYDNLDENSKNKDISNCLKKVRQNLNRKDLDCFYAWVREQNSGSNHPHFHVQLLLNGNKIQSGFKINEVVDSLWAKTINDYTPGLVHHCNDELKGASYTNGTLYSRSETIPVTILNQIGYMAKPNGKGSYKDGMRDFGMSRIPPSK